MPGRLLAFLGRNAPPFLAGGVLLGLVLPDLATAVRPALGPLVALLLGVSLLRLDWSQLIAYARRPGTAVLAAGWQLVLSPLLVWGCALLAGLPPGLAQALVINGAAPSLVASVALAQLLGLDAPLAVLLVVATTLVLPLTLTPVLFLLLDLELTIDVVAFLGRFALFIGLPFAAAWGLRLLLPDDVIERNGALLDGANVVILVLAALAMMDGVTARLFAAPMTVALFLAAAVAFNAGFQALGAVLYWRRGRRTAFSMGLSLGNRNMALMLVLTGGLLGPDLALYVAMAQIPVYLLPLVAKPLYGRLLRG
jgi:BASS family bile acid:Na+ symporter